MRLCVRNSNLLRVSGTCCFSPGGSSSPSPATAQAAATGIRPGGNWVPSARAIASASSLTATGSLPGEVEAFADRRAPPARSGPVPRSCRRCRSDAARLRGGR